MPVIASKTPVIKRKAPVIASKTPVIASEAKQSAFNLLHPIKSRNQMQTAAPPYFDSIVPAIPLTGARSDGYEIYNFKAPPLPAPCHPQPLLRSILTLPQAINFTNSRKNKIIQICKNTPIFNQSRV